jgi:LmbE family N-acetylglucosaminyl deacetylase
MNAVLFAPHNDDETLFAFYSMLKYRPIVVVVLRSFKQNVQQNGPHWKVREAETQAVMEMIGLEHVQWTYDDMRPDWPRISDAIADVIDQFDVVIAPADELGGHEDHCAVASICGGLTDSSGQELIRYLTYQCGYGRSTQGVPVPHTPEEELLKLQALGLYRSQMEHPATCAWFPGGEYEMLAEFVV